MSSSFDKFAILDSFLDEVGSYLPEIEANLDRLEQAPDDAEALEEAYRRTHTISGSASMMDFPGLSHVAHAMEDVLGDALDEVVRLEPPTTSLLRRSLKRVQFLLAAIKTGSDDEERIVAEDANDHARFRETREASLSGGHAIQEAIIVPPGAEEHPTPAHPFVESDDWPMLTPPAGAPAPNHTEAAPMAGPLSAGLPDWLALLATPESAGGEPLEPPRAEERPAVPTVELPSLAPVEQPAKPVTRPLPAYSFEQLVPPPEPGADLYRSSLAPPSVPGQTPFGSMMAGDDWRMQGFALNTQQSPAGPPSRDFGATTAQADAGGEPAQPSMEEMLAALRVAGDGEWPEQPLSVLAFADASDGALPRVPTTLTPTTPVEEPLPPSPVVPLAPPPAPLPPVSEPPALLPSDLPSLPWPLASEANEQHAPASLAWQGVVEHEADVRRGAAALKETLVALRAVAEAIENQRSELRGFLDGSKDAIDRLEAWAGRAMGLDLRQSPDHVRRYLPLSVLWVVTTQLKKTLAQLKDAANGLATTESEVGAASAGLAQAVRDCGTFVTSVLSLATPTEAGGLSATLAHFSWLPPRRDEPMPPASPPLPAAPLAGVLTQAGQEELREQLRGEVEQQIRAEITERVRREETERLRRELEIEVRSQMLSHLTVSAERKTPRRPTLSEEMMSAPAAGSKAKKVTRAAEQSEEALEVFRAEAEEHLQQIGAGVTTLERSPGDREALQSIRRFTHTLKGAAAMMGFVHVADLAHISEDLLDQIMEGTIEADKDVLSVILDTSEALELLVVGKTSERGGDEAVVEALRVRYQALLRRAGVAEDDAQREPTDESLAALAEEANEELVDSFQPNQSGGHALAVATSGAATRKDELSVRIKLKKLDELVNLFGELLVNRTVLDERLNRLLRMVAEVGLSSLRLRDVGGQLESRYETAMLSSGRANGQTPAVSSTGAKTTTGPLEAAPPFGRQLALPPPAISAHVERPPEHTADFDELELDRYNEFHRLTRGLSEGISDMATLSTEMETAIRECEQIFQRETRLSSAFQDQLLKVRLVPLSMIVPRLYRAAQAVALRLGKEVELTVEGEETEVDRTVYEEVAGPLLHLVRNAVTHGLEAPEVREAAGKPRAGQIKLSATYEANQVIITVREDGAGIDAERVRNTAIARGLLDARAPLSEQAVLNLIFRPGFSTAEAVSEESGRGVGLDVVHDVVSRLRGTIEVESTPGDGTAWTMKFPITLQIQRAVLARLGEQTFAIPMALVEQITRLDYHPSTRALSMPAIEVRGESYALVQLASLLGLPAGKIDERASVLLVTVGRQRYALLVDSVVGKQEIVVKNLGPHLREVRGVAGATVLGNGQVVLILEVMDLLAQQRLQSAALSVAAPTSMPASVGAQAPAQPRVQPPTWSSSLSATGRPPLPTAPPRQEDQYVLVVDDSPSVRRVVSNMLKMAGWEVQTARDGIEAMEVAAKRSPAAVLLDIEMPRMDGYELMATLRSQEQYRHLPLVVLTSRAAAKHHQRAFQLGADAYLVKPYQDEELLKTLNTLVKGARA